MRANGVGSHDELLGLFVARAQKLAKAVGAGAVTHWEEVFKAGVAAGRQSAAADTIFQVCVGSRTPGPKQPLARRGGGNESPQGPVGARIVF